MLGKIKQWYKNNNKMFIRCDASNSSIILSKKLFDVMVNDHPKDKNFSVLFTKIKSDSVVTYAMFFNPDWGNHGVSDPRMIQTIPVTIGKFGHIGFQSIQPSVMELKVMYGLKDDIFDIEIEKNTINGEPYYKLVRK